jgi:hypothetical protein
VPGVYLQGGKGEEGGEMWGGEEGVFKVII